MPTNRTPLKRARHSRRLVVTPEALAVWRQARRLRRGSAKYKDAEIALQRLLGLSKFESPLGRYSLIGDATSVRRWADTLDAALIEADAANREAEAE